MSSGVKGSVAFKILLTEIEDYFDRAPRCAVLETLHKFGVPTGTPFSRYLRYFCIIVASTIEKGAP